MRNLKRWAAVLLAASVALQSAAFPTEAMANPQQTEAGGEAGFEESIAEGDVLYTADLSNLDGFDTFTGASAGTWSAGGGNLRVEGGNGNKALAKGQDFTDFAYEANVTIERSTNQNGEAQGGLLFRAKDSVNGQADGYHGYYLGLNVKDQILVLGRSSGNNWHEIASKKMTIEYGKTYRLKVTAYGSHITCYVDDNGKNYAKIDVTDSTHTSGSIGARNWFSDSVFSDMKVTRYEETALPEDASYTNPILNMCADPDILYHNGTYFLYPTNAGDSSKGIKVYTSTDLVHWTDKGFAFKKGDGWGESGFWAPDLIERDGIFYMYYVANEQICVATSDSPLGPFTQDVKKPMHQDVKEIDAHVFYDEPSGKYYLYFVRFTAGNVIWGAELNDDMKTIKEDTVTEIVRADQRWDQDMGNINEGPFMLTKDGKYYLTYSGSHFESINYGSGYAVADSPLGPYTKYQNNPIMKSNSLAHGTGHHCVTESPDGTELFMVYHSHHDLQNTEPRQLCIDRMQFTEDAAGNTVLEVKGPTVTPQALPSGSVDANNFIGFDKEYLKGITVDNGTEVKDWGLPAKVGVHTSKSTESETYLADVTWDTSSYDAAQTQTQVLDVKGTAVLPQGIENLGNAPLEMEIKVTVNSADVDADKVKQALNKINIHAEDIRENITLPEEIDGVALTWESSNENVISTKEKKNTGYYTTPAGVVVRQDQDTKVNLTVTGRYQGTEQSRVIEATVRKKPQQKKYVGYLYAHFKEFQGQVGEQDIFFGISKDGKNWTALNDNKAILKSTVGDGATRDPYIVRSAEGDKFYLIATDQNIYRYGTNIPWDRLSTEGSQALTIWESTDLVHWTNQRNVPVAATIEGGCAWAPEAIYDEGTGEYLVYWSSKVKADNYARQYNWVSKTRDFYTFTEPELFNDLEISNIDTSVYREGNAYYKLVKQEGNLQNVMLQKAENRPLGYGEQVNQVQIGDKSYNNVGGIYQKIDNSAAGCLESFTGHYEGATMFKFLDREEWCIMVDEYGGATRGYIPFTTKNLDQPNSVKPLADHEYIMQDGGKHGCMIPITQEEYDALVEAYGVPNGALAGKAEQQEPVVVYDFEKEHKEFPITLFGNAEVKKDSETNSNVLYLDGSKDTYAALPQGMFDAMENMTIVMDVKPETTETNHVDFCIGQDRNRYLFLRFRDKEITSGVSVRSYQNEKNLIASMQGCLNKWVKVAIVLKDHDLSFYVGEEKIGTKKVRNLTELGESLISYLGKSFYDGDPFFKGSYDNIKVYNRALSSDELGASVSYKISQKLEAEDAALAGLAKVVSHSAASGGKKVGTIDNTSSTVTFTLEAPKDGTYRIEVAADGDPAFPNPEHRYWVNGNNADSKVVQYKPAGWDNWNLYPIEVELKEGTNTLTFSHSGREKSFAELDYITFYTAYPNLSVMVGGEEMEAFDMDTATYEWDVEDLSSIPEVTASVSEDVREMFDISIRQGTKQRPEAYITVTSPADPGFEKQYMVRFLGDRTFQNVLVNFGADPFVTFEDGYYYYIRVNHDKSIWVSKSKELSRIGQVEPKKVYTPSGDEPNREMWAPEIHFLNGKWYIYYTAGAGSNHRMYVLESKTSDAQGAYTFKGKMSPTTDRWAIDQTVLEHDGQLYAIWSGWDGTDNVDQRTYIAKMDNPWTISGERVELSKPEYSWEKQGGNPTINEGAQIVKAPDGTVNIVYSASGSWSDFYCLGCLTLKKGADPMKKDSWIKAKEPIFQKNDSTTFSTGHASFTTSPDGTEDYVVYHATRHSGDGWNGRGVRTQRVYWNEDGTPDIGQALEYGARINWPSGTPVIDYARFEAEDGVLKGNARVEETYNSSGGKKATGLNEAADQVVFTVQAKEAATYRMFLGAAASEENAGLSVKVNDGEAFDRTVANFNANAANRIVRDNWSGYEIVVPLKKGENTITVGKSSKLTVADLDYLEAEPCLADGHKWEGEAEILKEATCEENGIQRRRCGTCGLDAETEIPALGHTGGTATCAQKAVCDRCKQPYGELDSSKHGAKELRDVKAATCTEAGHTGNEYCKDCGAKVTEGEAIPALGHTGGSATCAEKAVCDRCKQPYGELDSSKHGAKELRDVKAATCTEAGHTGNEYCKDCGKKLSEGKSIPATGHKWDGGKVTVAPTADKAGVKTYTCTSCGTKRTEAIPAAGAPAVGKEVKDKTGVYRIEKNRTVSYQRPSGSPKEVTIPKEIKVNGVTYKVTSIAQRAFKKQTALTKVTVGDNIVSIGRYAFSGCSKLKSVKLGKNVTTMGDGVFFKCVSLTKITIPSKVTVIRTNTFFGCKKLASVKMGSKVTEIGTRAFRKCGALKEITIPSKVKKIGARAFFKCGKLKKITIKTKMLTSKKIGKNAFKGISSKAVIKAPKGKVKAYKKMLRAKGVGSKVKITR